jgi:hypothetical protein
MDAAERDDVAELARADLPGLVAAVAAAEAGATETAAVEAAARAPGPHVPDLERVLRLRGGHVSFESTPTVMGFLETVYINEKQLREDQNRHVENYIRLFARIAGDRPLAEYKRLDILNWVRTLETQIQHRQIREGRCQIDPSTHQGITRGANARPDHDRKAYHTRARAPPSLADEIAGGSISAVLYAASSA